MTTLPTSLIRTDIADLQQHVQQCVQASGRMHRMRCAAEAANALMAHRLASALALLALTAALAALLWPG